MRILWLRPLPAIFTLSTACDLGNRQDERSVQNSESVAECSEFPFPVVSPAGEKASPQKCDLVRRALDAIARGQGNPEFAPADTSQIVSASVSRFAFKDTTERSLEPYWSVDFRMRNRSRDASVHITESGALSAGAVHK